MAPTLLLLFTVLMTCSSMLVRAASAGFDVRRHLGTKTRYAYRLAVPGAPSAYKAKDPEGYDPVHLYLLSRHGTRWPTGDRMRQINSLEALFRDARNTAEHPWVRNWTAPFPDVTFMGGELHPIGADELWGLAYRLRKRFPSLANQTYLPKRYPVVSTQVARTAASASAFTSGFFKDVTAPVNPADDSPTVNYAPPFEGRRAESGGEERRGEAVMDLDAAGRPRRGARQQRPGPALSHLDELDESLRGLEPSVRRPQAVAMSMAPKNADPLLRFFDVCPAYAQHDEYTEKWMSSWMQGNWSRLLPALESRLGLSRDMRPCEVEALWQLCLLEAGLDGRADRACSLFEPEEALMLEWIDDVHLLETQSYGAPINFQIAAPLLRDAVASLRGAAEATGTAGESAPAARLLFAHCETLVPLATLLGLFRPPAPPPPDASAEAMDAAVSPASAQRHLQQVDTLEDLQMVVSGLTRQDRPRRGGSATSPGGALGSEDSHVCYKGRPFSPGGVPTPEGWYPMFGNDDSRLFKGARLAPYGANLAFVLYRRRGGGAAPSGSPAHLVRLLYNEQVVPIPGCDAAGSGLECDLEAFMEVVQGKIDADALERLCGSEGQVVRGDGGASLMYERAAPRRGGGGGGNENPVTAGDVAAAS